MIISILEDSIRALIGLKLFICLKYASKGLEVNRVLFQQEKNKLNINQAKK